MEYALLIALIAAVIFGAVALLAPEVLELFSTTEASIQHERNN